MRQPGHESAGGGEGRLQRFPCNAKGGRGRPARRARAGVGGRNRQRAACSTASSLQTFWATLSISSSDRSPIGMGSMPTAYCWITRWKLWRRRVRNACGLRLGMACDGGADPAMAAATLEGWARSHSPSDGACGCTVGSARACAFARDPQLGGPTTGHARAHATVACAVVGRCGRMDTNGTDTHGGQTADGASGDSTAMAPARPS